jgi:asparagine synthase (glutamine-hydrolysing)
MHNEDKTVWIVLNGAIFNHIEIRDELVKRGHKFYTKSDTEVLIHLYEDKGLDMFSGLNGQFAFALWDTISQRLILARDRVGICPLFYTQADGALIFASEVKSIFVDKRVERRIDLLGLDQIFTYWSTNPPRSVFENIRELPPGSFMIAEKGQLSVRRYWQPSFFDMSCRDSRTEDDYAGELLELLKDSIRIRLRADVPVAAYLSGGLDSSIITALVKKHFNNRLETFSVSFSDSNYDEGAYQRRVSDFLGTKHRNVTCDHSDIGRIMPQVVWLAEKPLIRTAPAPLFLLSKLARKNHIKAVLTGEGSDEIMGGYDLFREMKIRRFWARFPESRLRPLLIRKLYSYIPNWPRSTSAFLEAFYKKHLLNTDVRYYSHLPRWDMTSRIKNLFSTEVKAALSSTNAAEDFGRTLPDEFDSWDPLSQAQYIEMVTLLSGNLLSSQGDRMMMGNSVEGRLPFLDHRVIEFCAKLPPRMKLKVMKEKYLLKKIAGPYLPEEICKRPKQAYRAPDSASFFKGRYLKYVSDLLSADNVRKTGYFDADMVGMLVNKCKKAEIGSVSARDNMAVVGVVTTLLLHDKFIRR